MFAGNTMLLPKAMTANPEVFNKGQLNGPGPSAGPFIVSNIDRAAQRITLTRNPKWWGTPPQLDTITYLVLDDAAAIPALQNNAIDATGLATLDELTIAQRTARHRRSGGRRPQLVPLHLQRRTRVHPGRQGAAAGGHEGHRPAGHRQRHPARTDRPPGRR